MASNAIQLRAKAKKLSIPNYRTMGLDELRKAVEGAGAAPSKRKSADNSNSKPKNPKRKTAASVTTAAPKKRKAPAKKTPAAKSDTGKAKRSSAGGAAGARVTCKVAGCRRKAPARGRYAGYCDNPDHRAQKGSEPAAAPKSTKRKSPSTTKATRSAPERKVARGGKDAPGRQPIDNAKVDWTAEWNGGKSGNRKLILAALRKFKGDKSKAHKALAPKATTMYPKQSNGRKRSEASAKALLRWHIGRVAFDFVMATSQHEISGNRVGYGERAQKATGATQTRKPRKAKAPATPKRKTAQKAAGRGKKKTARK